MIENYNPDVLTCLANLSNDEVFTPPELVNDILDLLPKELFENKETTFLDPVCKSGVFLREIAKRLMTGLEKEIPDKQKRINHIFKNQLFGIAITELTSYLSRRSVYCSKTANGKYSVCDAFDDAQGNIGFKRIDHTWKNGKCIFCGAGKKAYSRGKDLETHAYQFIHTTKPEEIFNMKFDVIIGNPPYQLNDGGGTGSSAKPIYYKFIEQAKKLNPRFITMIIPARWYSGGKGLDSFRKVMLSDKRIRQLIDFEDSRDCFPSVDIAGGVCYFLWDRDNQGKCNVITNNNTQIQHSERFLDEFDTFIRSNTALNLIQKINKKSDVFLDSIVSSRMPFGLTNDFKEEINGKITLISSSGISKISIEQVTNGKQLVKKWKVLLSKTASEHAGQPDKEGKRRVFSRIEVMPPNVVCTESYLIVGNFENEQEAINAVSFLKSKFCRFLVSSILLTQNITKSKFVFVPMQDFSKPWTDEELYKKYGLTNEEIAFIESMIRPME